MYSLFCIQQSLLLSFAALIKGTRGAAQYHVRQFFKTCHWGRIPLNSRRGDAIQLFISLFAGAAHAVIRAESSGAWYGSGLSNACDKESAVAQTTSSCRLSCHLSYHPAACVTFLRQFYSRSVATFFLSSFL
jgi:hypothetical protein